MGGDSYMGSPQTPMPTLGWTGMSATLTVSFTKVTARARLYGSDSVVAVLMATPAMSAPAAPAAALAPGSQDADGDGVWTTTIELPPGEHPYKFVVDGEWIADRIDDETAHCVSGVNLSEGDYPVGGAFPHPKERSSFFCLVNLPTPR